MKSFIAITVVVLTFCTVQFGQDIDGPEHLSPIALSKIVDVVLRAEFKSSEELALIHIHGNVLKEAWLPEIVNTQFILIDDAELERLGKAYLFKDPVVSDGKVRIDFGYGNNCEAGGGSYFFKVRGDRVTRTNDNGGWGSGCSSASGGTRSGQ
jgi:hypothetical protein